LLTRAAALVFLLVLTLPAVLTPEAYARSLFLHVTIDMEPGFAGETVVVSGRVTDDAGAFVPGVAISTQVNNPFGTIIVAAFTYTGADGSYSVTFRLGPDSPEGNYTVYLTASRSGYEDDRARLGFSLSSPEFTVHSNPRSATVQQGKSAVFQMIVDARNQTKKPITFGLLGVPPKVNYTFVPKSVTAPGSTTLTLTAGEDAQTGLYNITILASSGAKVRRTNIVLVITQAFIPFVFSGVSPLAIAGAVGVGALVAAIAVRLLIGQRGAPSRGEIDRDYLAAARALARLEEMRAHDKIDEATYQRLKKEYEERIEKKR